MLGALVAAADARLTDPLSDTTLTPPLPVAPRQMGGNEPPPAALRHLAMLNAADLLRRDGDVDKIEALLDGEKNPTGALVGLDRLAAIQAGRSLSPISS